MMPSEVLPLDERFYRNLSAALLAANFYGEMIPRWPVSTKVYPIEDEE